MKIKKSKEETSQKRRHLDIDQWRCHVKGVGVMPRQALGACGCVVPKSCLTLLGTHRL